MVETGRCPAEKRYLFRAKAFDNEFHISEHKIRCFNPIDHEGNHVTLFSSNEVLEWK